MATNQVFNARTQQVETATLKVDANNEIVVTFEDGGFFKLPAGLTKKQFHDQLKSHQTANDGQEVITPEMVKNQAKERAASLALIGEDTTSESQSNDDQAAPAS